MNRCKQNQAGGNFRVNALSPGTKILGYVRDVDHAFFNAHPGTDDFVREFITGEFGEGRLPFGAPPSGSRFAVHVHAFRDPNTAAVIMRTRSFTVVSCSTPLQWYACSIISFPGRNNE